MRQSGATACFVIMDSGLAAHVAPRNDDGGRKRKRAAIARRPRYPGLSGAYFRFVIAVRSKENLPMTAAPHQRDWPDTTPVVSPVSRKHWFRVRSVIRRA